MKLHENIRLLTWFNFFTDFRPYAPVAIIYFASVTGSYALGMAVFSMEMLSTSIAELPTGIISDLVGRKKTIVLGALMAVVALIFYAIGTNFWILMAGSMFAGLARSFYSGNNQALLHESLKEYGQEKGYAEYAGKTSSMFQFALAISAVLGGLIAYYSMSLVMWISVIPQIVCLFIALRMEELRIHSSDEETNIYSHLKDAIRQFKENSKLRTLSIASMLDYGIGETLYQFSSAFIVQLWPVWAIGVSKMLSNLFGAVGMRWSGRVTKKFGFFRSLVGANLYSRILGITGALFPSPLSPILLASTSSSYGVSTIAKDSLFQREFSDKQRATMGSLNSLMGNLFFAGFAFVFGLIADMMQTNQALILGEILQFSVLIAYWSLFAKKMV